MIENDPIRKYLGSKLTNHINKSQSASRYLKNYKMLRIKSYLKLYTL